MCPKLRKAIRRRARFGSTERFDGPECLRYHAAGRLAGHSVPAPTVSLWRSEDERTDADCESTGAQGPEGPEGEDEDAPSRGLAAEAGRLHARFHDHAEEAELGSAQGRPRPLDERPGGHLLHSRG